MNLINSGVTTVVAAGNDNVDAIDSSPARVSAAITVGAATIADAKASYSNYGSVVDVWAPGTREPLTVLKIISLVPQVPTSSPRGTTVEPTPSLEPPWPPPTLLVSLLTCLVWTPL